MTEFETYRWVNIQLGRNEWGNQLMQKVAREFLTDPANAGPDPILVVVDEHAGWSLGYTFWDDCLICVTSANDQASFAGKGGEWRRIAAAANVTYLDPVVVRRPNGACSACGRTHLELEIGYPADDVLCWECLEALRKRPEAPVLQAAAA